MKKILFCIIGIVILLGALFGGIFTPVPWTLPTNGHVGVLQARTTLQGIYTVLTDGVSTQVAVRGNYVLFFWPTQNGGMGFVGLDIRGGWNTILGALSTQGKGNLVNLETYNAFKDALIREGWKFSKFGELALALGAEINMAVLTFSNTIGLWTPAIIPIILPTPNPQA